MTLGALLSIFAIHLIAAMSPGPSFVVCLRTAASRGFGTAAGLAIGFGLGAMAWAAAAVAGLALLFQVIPTLYLGMKLLGAAFLIWLGVQMWRHAKTPLDTDAQSLDPMSIPHAIRFGLLTFAANPKTAVFFSAVFAGLVPPDTGFGWLALIVLVVGINETLWYLLVARLFSLARAQGFYIRAKSLIDRGFGTLMALFGLKIALG